MSKSSLKPLPILKALPNAETNLTTLPNKLLNEKTWIRWKPIWKVEKNKYIKKPLYSSGIKETHKFTNFNDLVNKNKRYNTPQYLGFYLTKETSIIIIDIDDPTDQDLVDFVHNNPTFTEYSPSGKSSKKMHAWYSLPVGKEHIKSSLKSKYFRRKNVKTELASELFCYDFFVTITGSLTINSTSDIHALTNKTLVKLLKLFEPINVVDINTKKQIKINTKANFPDLSLWVNTVPISISNPLVKLRCGQQGWDHYTYWLTALASLHYYTNGSAEGLTYADQWSQKDTTKYASFSDVQTKWNSFNLAYPKGITERTYMMYFRWFLLDWPMKPQGKPPIPGDYHNFLALLTHYGLTINIDLITLIPFIDGPKHLIFPKFYEHEEEQFSYQNNLENISAKLFTFSQQFYKPSFDQIQKHIRAYCLTLQKRKYYNPFISWIELKEWDKKDRLKDLLNCYQINERYTQTSLAHIFIKRWLYSVLRTFYKSKLSKNCQRATYEGLLILSGPERTNKTTSFRLLLPPEFERYYVSAPLILDNSSNEKDSILRTTGRLISVCDEIEGVIESNKEARLKEFITRPFDTIRPPYGTKNFDYPRQCALAGTTNRIELQIPEDGARRYWIIRIRSIDTFKMQDINLQQLWAQLKYELIEEGKNAKYAPWLLTDEELKEQRLALMYHFTTSNEFDMLVDTYDWDLYKDYIYRLTKKPDTNWRRISKSIADICLDLDIKRKKSTTYAVQKVLKTFGLSKIHMRGGNVIEYGFYRTGTSPKAQIRYIMPPKRVNIFSSHAERELE